MSITNTIDDRCQVSLLGAFRCRIDQAAVQLPRAAERLVAYLGLQDTAVTRHRAAGVLWPEVPEERALASLRSALWRLRRDVAGLIEANDVCLRLSSSVTLDTRSLADHSNRLVDDSEVDLRTIDPTSFGSELLPGWYDDWVLFERERLRQLSLHGLEALSRRQATVGHFGQAVDAAMVAIAMEPLRESAHATLVNAHLAEGNLSEAVRRLEAYAAMLRAELGVRPGAALTRTVEEALANQRGSLSAPVRV